MSFRLSVKLSFRLSEANGEISTIMYKTYYVYILSNKTDTVLYIGVTNNIERRIQEHKSRLISGFTQTYNCDKLVYLESYSDINQALDREKQLKKWRREKKEWLIRMQNPEFIDMSKGFLDSLRSLEMTEETKSLEMTEDNKYKVK